MTERLLILGAGGHGKACAEVAMMNYHREIAFLDDEVRAGTEILGFPVLGKISVLEELRKEGDAAFVAIGNNQRRREIFDWLKTRGVPVATLCEPSAVVSYFAQIGEGVLLMPRVVVNAGARVGEGAILNTAAVVEHDCDIGAFAHLSPGVCLGGGARIGEGAHLGLGAIVLPNVTVGAGAVAGAGCVINKDLNDNVVAVGLPARIIRHADSTIPSEHYRSRTESRARRAVHAASVAGRQAG
jgi:sugar O-acyltransferase (sialic acid O-acetyltransferase NeuD family)